MDRTVETFTALWWETSGLTVAITAVMLVVVRRLRPHQRTLYARGLGWVLLSWMVLPPLAHALIGHWNLSSGLPLQWCDFTGGIAGLAVLTRRQPFYEVSLFWGIAGAGSALLTPTFTQGTDWFFLMEFYISHSILLTAPFFLSIYADMRPRAWSWLASLGWLNAVALVMLLFDYLIDANYMFLLQPPAADLAVYRIGWPYYLVGFEVGCLVAFALIYAPFRLVGAATRADSLRRRAVSAPAQPGR